jgi:hypothetical protein
VPAAKARYQTGYASPGARREDDQLKRCASIVGSHQRFPVRLSRIAWLVRVPRESY